MISLKKAKALKEAGLIWEPKLGDWFWCDAWDEPQVIRDIPEVNPPSGICFAPRLDQLLDEIEKISNKYWSARWFDNSSGYEFCLYGDDYKSNIFKGKTLEDAVSETLLWVLDDRKNKKEE